MRCLLLVFILQMPAAAETHPGKWWHRGTASLFCATAAVDAYQTVSAAGRPGIYESSPLFRTRHGASTPALIGVKGLLCAGSLLMGERMPPSRRGFLDSVNLTGAGVNTFVILHNRNVMQAAHAKE